MIQFQGSLLLPLIELPILLSVAIESELGRAAPYHRVSLNAPRLFSDFRDAAGLHIAH